MRCDMIVDSIDYDIPASICERVRTQYATKKTLPLLINGIKKLETERSPRLNSTFDSNGDGKMKRKMSSIIFDDNGKKNSYNKFESSYNVVIPPQLVPKVLTVKPLEVIVEGLQL